MPKRRPRRVLGGLCAKGHVLTAENVYPAANGSLRCQICHREWNRRRFGHQPRHYNRLGGTCGRGHLLTPETVYKRANGGYQCAVCHGRTDAARTPPKPMPAEKRCDRCHETKPIADFRTPGAKACDRCIYTRTNGKRCAAKKRETISRRAEAVSIVAYCRTGAERLIAERGWTNGGVAAALDVPRWSFRRWVLGERLPQPGRVAGLADGMTTLLSREGLS